MYRSRSRSVINIDRPLTCKKCKNRYTITKAIKLSDARGTNNFCCPHCGAKNGTIY